MRFALLLAFTLLPFSATACEEHANMAAEPVKASEKEAVKDVVVEPAKEAAKEPEYEAVIQASDAWTRPTPPSAKTAALYFTLTNKSDKPVAITSAFAKAAEKTEIHETTMVDGVAKMRPIPGLDIPAKGDIAFKPGGLHVMLFGLKEPLKAGDKVILNLSFENGEKLSVAVNVGSAPEKDGAKTDAKDEAAHGDHH